ncbi:MAG: hypothetical protein QNJ38_24860 [Prochloraceae cyanobacterium]|nr:hypothetical protein [Prochloraceae cyanobacterium]
MAVINIGFNFITLLGLLDILFAAIFIIASVVFPVTRRRIVGQAGITLYVFQLFIAPIVLLICGGIILFYGWMLNAILQLAFFLLHLLIAYLTVKDIIIFDKLYDRYRGRY